MKAGGHLQGAGCPKCGFERTAKSCTITKSEYLDRVNQFYNNKYSYSDFILKTIKETKLEITCSEHGKFIKSASKHLYGQGCPKCARKKMNTYGTTIEGFIKACKNNKGVGIFYIMKFIEDGNVILKHGITARTASQRAKEIKYKPEILLEIKGNPIEIYLFEQLIKQLFKKYKYCPKIKFCGHTECVLLDFPFLINKEIFENSFKNDRFNKFSSI